MRGVNANRPEIKLAWALPLLLLFACGAAAVDEEPRPDEFLPDFFEQWEWDAIAPPVAEVDRIIKRMRTRTADSIWRDVTELSRLPRGAGKIMLARARQESETVRLGLARAACRIGQVAAGGKLLVEIARRGTNRKVRLMAIQALALTPKMKSQAAVVRALNELLNDLRRGRRRDPLLRVALCHTLWELTGGQVYIRRLRRLTLDADPAAANEAALVLAENGKLDLVREHLLRINSDPTPQGARAQLILRYNREPSYDLKLLDEILQRVRKEYVDEDKATDIKKMITAAADAMVSSLDPFSSYLNEDAVQAMRVQIAGVYGGIGAWVDMRNNIFTVVSPIYGGPAYKVGLKSLDQVIEVDGQKTRDIKFEEVIGRLKGQPGTSVKVKIYRRGWTGFQEFTIVRELVKVKSVYSRMLPGQVGYVRLSRFGEKSTADLDRALDDLERQGLRGLVLDLTNNPGGLLSAAVDVTDLFLQGGKLIVYSQGREDASRKDFRAGNVTTHPDWPMVVLINRGSASASEIVAGALQDHDRATLVGQTSFGKGSVQSILPLSATLGQTQLRLTVAKYYLPSDRSIHETGVDPDVAIEPTRLPGWQVGLILKYRSENNIQEYVSRLWKGSLRGIIDVLAGDDEDLATDLLDLNGFALKPYLIRKSKPDDIASVKARVGRLRALARRLIEDQAFKQRVLAVARRSGIHTLDENEKTDIFALLPRIRQRLLRTYYELAETDYKQWERYPGFDELYRSLQTNVPASFRDAVRAEVRRMIRQRVADDRGAEFVCDVQEDVPLQRAIYELLKKMTVDPTAFRAYEEFPEKFKPAPKTTEAAAVPGEAEAEKAGVTGFK